MMTIKEMSELTGVSARTLRYYDEIGLFHPTEKSEAGYRLYDEKALETLQQILYFRELDIPLNTIKEIVDNPALDRNYILQMQKKMLITEKKRLERLINSIDIAMEGTSIMDFTVFSREESEELFQAMLEHMPETLRDAAMQEFGSVEKWKAHYIETISSEKVQKQYAEVVEWYGGKKSYMTSVKNPLSKELAGSHQQQLNHVLDKLFQKRGMEIHSSEIRELIGEYGFVMKQMLQLKDEKGMMLAQAKLYLDEKIKQVIDEQYGEGFSSFLNRAITAFYVG